MSPKELEEMVVGTEIPGAGIITGVTPEGTVLRLIESSPKLGEFIFKVTYMGIFVCEVAALVDRNKVFFEELS